jgi:hypothetical protein
LWIKQRISRLVGRLGMWFTAFIAHENNREEALAKAELLTLNDKLFTAFSYARARQVKFDTAYANVLSLTTVLRAAQFAINNHQQFDIAQLPTESRLVSLEDFFLDSTGRYIAPGAAVTSFKKEALSFLNSYYAIGKVDYGIEHFNQRVLSKLLKSTLQTAQTLKDFTQ